MHSSLDRHSPSFRRAAWRLGLALASLASVSASGAFAQATDAAGTDQSAAAAAGSDTVQLEPLTVVGSRENLESLPGSGAFIDAGEFRETGNITFNRITARVPGVYVREEDGYGNFINVSIRGVDGSRSNKVTLMEDGILTAPSPYSAPAAYYSPKLGRMSGIEILKGSSQIAYGPHTTGGVVNFLSTPVPASRAFYSRTTVGTDSTLFNHTTYGDVAETTDGGTVGYLVELHAQRSDGYRKIDGTSRDTGFTLVEPMVKVFLEPGTALRQRFEAKFGYTNFDANESYAGITVADLRADPDRRYAASRFDNMEAEHWRSYLKHIMHPTDDLRVETAVYHNRFERTWDKLDGLAGAGLRTNVAQALLHAPSLAVLQGTGTGNIFTREAYREHVATGVQSQLTYEFDAGSVGHRLDVGVRLHEDSAEGTNQRKLTRPTATAPSPSSPRTPSRSPARRRSPPPRSSPSTR